MQQKTMQWQALRNGARLPLGLLYLAAALLNVYLAIANPEIYRTWSENALMPFYSTFFAEIRLVYLSIFVGIFAIHQFVVGLLILHRGQSVQDGLIGALFFHIFVVPLGIDPILNLTIIFLLATLLPASYQRSFLSPVIK